MKKNICLKIVLGLMVLKEGQIYARPHGVGAFHGQNRHLSGFSGRARVPHPVAAPQARTASPRTAAPVARAVHSPNRSGGQRSHSVHPSPSLPSAVQGRLHSGPVGGRASHPGGAHHPGNQGWSNSTNNFHNSEMSHGVQNLQGLPGTANFSAEGISTGGLVAPIMAGMAGMAGFSDPVPVPMSAIPPVPVAAAPMMSSVAQSTPIVSTPDPIVVSAPSSAPSTDPSDAAMMGSADFSTPVLSPSITDSLPPSDPSAALTVPTPNPSLTSTPPSDPSTSLANSAPSDTPSPNTSSPEAALATAGEANKTEAAKADVAKLVVKKSIKKPPSLLYVKPVKAFCVDGSAIGNVAAVQEGKVLGPQVLEIEYSDTPQGQSGFRNLALACSKKTPPSTLNIARLKGDLRRLHYRSNPIISHANEKLVPEVGTSAT